MLELILSYQPVFNLSLAPGYSKTVLKELGKEIILHQVTIYGQVKTDSQLDGFSSAKMNLWEAGMTMMVIKEHGFKVRMILVSSS
jgi:hypothetical protein